MNALELIKLLKQFPGDSQVVIPSYEEGFDPITDCKNISIQPNNIKEWYVGIYDTAEKGEDAVLISSKFTRAEKEGKDEE